jgi:hypothetical protein
MACTNRVARIQIKCRMSQLGHVIGQFKREKHTSEERYEVTCKQCGRRAFMTRVSSNGRKRRYYNVTGTPLFYTCLTLQSAPKGSDPTVNILPPDYFPRAIGAQ